MMLQAELTKFYNHPVAQISAGLIMTILAVAFFAFIAIKPTLETMAELIKEIDEKRTVDQKLSLKITALSSAQAELASKGEKAKVIDEAVPSTPEFTRLLKMVERLTAERNVIFTSMIVPTIPIERDPLKKGTEVESIPLSVNFSGTYSDLYALLNDMQTMRRTLIIDRVDIVPSTDKENTNLNLSVSVRAFAFSPTVQKKKTAKAI
jgi:Tfp pilus assembly protein PilO